MTRIHEHELVQELLALGTKYQDHIARLESENLDLQEQLFDLQAYHRTREEEKYPSDLVKDLVISRKNPVRVFREYRGLSQQKLEEKSGVSQAIISGIENGKRRGSVDNFKALAEALAVDVDDLI